MRKENGEFARLLRQQQTQAEQVLWRCLRARQFMDLKFRRQYPLPPYVLDFYCAEIALVLELDGSQHAQASAYDARRTDFLQARGLTVLRYWNNDVIVDTAAVLESLRCFIINRPSPRPSPRERGKGETGAEKREE